ncbi:MAG TPA: phosphatidylglycerol lysyltransferase domain-containing protein, partial [Parvularculaceae bacterium]|nr:phosphatidylglycerol lysyltransferase domain-containing protein [Parvularculaceae bacterium]
ELDDRVGSIIAEGDSVTPDANLAYLRDKRFLFSESGRSFIMYGIQGRNWIAMGAPVGMTEDAAELAWAFKALADSYGGNVVFYSISEKFLPVALDLGLGVQKVGETAIIPLDQFSLEGGRRSRLRQARRGLEKEGCSFEVISPEAVGACLGEMRAVSDEWLGSHHGEEKQFTLGRFDEDYIRRFPAAIVRRGGKIIAFANLWASPHSRSLSVDLMRYGEDAPDSVMVGLFVELILWGQANGYAELNLGMAPLAGLDRRRIAPMMSRLGAFLFEHGERIYGFEGLRQFKEKFQPAWKPLYLAAPSKLDVAFALGGVALLTSGGIRGILRGRAPRSPGWSPRPQPV